MCERMQCECCTPNSAKNRYFFMWTIGAWLFCTFIINNLIFFLMHADISWLFSTCLGKSFNNFSCNKVCHNFACSYWGFSALFLPAICGRIFQHFSFRFDFYPRSVLACGWYFHIELAACLLLPGAKFTTEVNLVQFITKVCCDRFHPFAAFFDFKV